ncbi:MULTISPECIES: DUF4198 domain-containing protein [unclassified Mesorhizobium]|uniref:DUF4198 domain-containing protein n=1 Tax=unclassified Mesorhizobium TaxID=325217 RepID=UPI0003CEF5ED|nr:sodium:proton antiporter [Mesorhizobium sp. LNJC374B00]ESY56690.1 sodium:proton antiporter [Mesorhizobium sp. LNJC372A00]
MTRDGRGQFSRILRSRGWLALSVLFACGAFPAGAHDFWIAPSSYWISPAVVVGMTLQVGHGLSRQRSPIPLRRIVRFEAVGPDGARTDLKAGLNLGGSAEDGSFTLQKPGLNVIVLQTDSLAQTHLPSIRFNDYLEAEGLTPALDLRTRLGRMDRDGSENYSRCAKSIMQVGPVGTGPPGQITRPLGLPLEIVPDRSPYALPRSAAFPVRVLYLGRPLAGALVKLTHLEDDAAPLESRLTDQAGRATFTLPIDGSWLLNVIWTRSQPSWAETDFETTFSSLSFGFLRSTSTPSR